MSFWKTHHISPNPASVKLIDQWQSELVYCLLVSCKTKEKKKEKVKTPSFPLKKLNKNKLLNHWISRINNKKKENNNNQEMKEFSELIDEIFEMRVLVLS